MQDVAVADFVLRRAEDLGLGTDIELWDKALEKYFYDSSKINIQFYFPLFFPILNKYQDKAFLCTKGIYYD